MNQKGMILPLTLAMSLMIALLLLHLSYRIEDQARLYHLERDHLTLSLLKKRMRQTNNRPTRNKNR